MLACGRDVSALTPEVVDEYLAARRSAGYVHYRSVKAIRPLLDYLEPLVVATPGTGGTGAGRCSIAERHALVSGVDGQTLGIVQDNDRANLEGLELKPHRVDRFKLSKDPLFVEKVYDVVGLYLNPPEAAVVLCVDE